MPTALPFVGREDIIEKLLCSIRPGRAAFWISGPAGVGKTYLVENLRQCFAKGEIDEDYVERLIKDKGYNIRTEEWFYFKKGKREPVRCLFAQTDHRQRDAAQAMNRLLSDLDGELERQGCSSKKWQKAYEGWRKDYKRYEELLRRAESYLNAPPDLRQTLAMWSVRMGGIMVGTLAPIAAQALGGPVVAGVVSAVTPEIVSASEERVKGFLEDKFEAEDRELLYKAIELLTPKFTNAFSQLDSDTVRVVLVLDEYEQTCTFLERWLILLFDDDFFQKSKAIILILSQYPFSRVVESQYYTEFSEIRLEPFDYVEVRGCVSPEHLGHTDYIYQHSGGLPLLVEALVQAGVPLGARATDEAIRDALHRLDRSILKLIKDNHLKQFARLCAVPRLLNEDVFEDVEKFMLDKYGCNLDRPIQRLESQPFVKNWRYDPTVRAVLLRSLYGRSRRAYEGLNRRLEDVCASEIETRDLSGSEWCDAQATRWYHALAASPRKSLAKALSAFVESLDRYCRPDDPPGAAVFLDIVSILEDLRKVRQEEEAFRLWSDYVSSFHKDVEDDVSGDKWDERYLELFKQLIEFHYHLELPKGDVRFRAYQDYVGFSNEQLTEYLKRYGRLLLLVENDYGEAYEQFRRALKQGDQDSGTRIRLFLSFIRLAKERPSEAQKSLQRDEAMLNRLLPELPQGLADRFNGVRERLPHA